MKYTVLFYFIFLIVGCNQQDANIVEPSNNKLGNVSLAFDKTNAPAAVKWIVVSLSRSGYSTLERSIDLFSDSSASIIFEQMPVGKWKINVDAKNQDNQILFTGQSEVDILENVLSQVSLVLKPVLTGVGSVQIFISWGSTPSSGWIDYENNAVLMRSTFIEANGVAQPQVFKIDEKYYMYYGALTNISRVCLATSYDGVVWTKYGSNPVIDIGSEGRWDDGSVTTGPVIKIDTLYYMYYQGFSYTTGQHSVGYAISSDGINWKRSANNRIKVNNNYVYHASSVLKKDNKYFLYYDGFDPSTGMRAIFLASSTNGIDWISVQNQPVLKKTFGWEDNGVTFSTIIVDNGMYKTVYADNGYNTCNFGIATSADGIVWEKEPQMIFNYTMTSKKWAAGGVVYPFLTVVGNQKRIYYVGIVSTTNERKIGFAYYK